MDLLFFTAEPYPTFRADVNVLFGKYLPRFGVKSDVVTDRMAGHRTAPTWGGGKALLCSGEGGRALQHMRKFAHNLWQLSKFRPSHYHAIQVRDLPFTASFGLLLARLKGKKFFYWMSFPIPESHLHRAYSRGKGAGLRYWFPLFQGGLGKWLLYRFVLPNADHIFVQTQVMLDKLALQGIAIHRMTPVPMGVDLEAAKPEAVSICDNPLLTGKRVLVYLGTLDRARQIDVLFEMLAVVGQSIPNIHLVLVGDTEDNQYRSWLKQRAEEVGVSERVLWTGWLPMAQGWQYVRTAEVGLSPIPRGQLLDVGSPTKAIEYLALGIPVVGNDNPDQAWVIQESGAGRCVPYTPEDFASAVIALLNLDPAERADMAERGKRFVREHRDYAVIARMVAARYQQLMVS
jgi:glycosyltransferase involved in cell wall biosynthesis